METSTPGLGLLSSSQCLWHCLYWKVYYV